MYGVCSLEYEWGGFHTVQKKPHENHSLGYSTFKTQLETD